MSVAWLCFFFLWEHCSGNCYLPYSPIPSVNCTAQCLSLWPLQVTQRRKEKSLSDHCTFMHITMITSSVSPADYFRKCCFSLPYLPKHFSTPAPEASATQDWHMDVPFPCHHLIHHCEFLFRSQPWILF